MRILVLGGTGMLGREVVKATRRFGHMVIAPRHMDVDITNVNEVAEMFRYQVPDFVINCAGIVKGAIEPTSEYIRVNALAPHLLAELCNDKCRVIHVSTDCVFSGKDKTSLEYDESDIPCPSDTYGRSKLLGEVRSPHLTVRTSFIGLGERGLIAWLLRQNGEITGYDEAYWNGFTTPVVAELLVKLCELNPAVSLLHLGGQEITKYSLLVRLAEAFGATVTIKLGPTPDEYRVNRVLGTLHLDLWHKLNIWSYTYDRMIKDLAGC